MNKLKPLQLRNSEPTPKQFSSIKRQDIYIVLDDVLDTYNVGSVFRLADAVGAKKVYLCGRTETPPNSRIKKASINTWQWVPWTHVESAVDAINELRKTVSDINIVAVEQDEKSVPFESVEYHLPLALIVGHETDGVSKEALDLSDAVIELPMFGINTSLNVMVTLGIVLYNAIAKLGVKQ